MKDDYLWYGSGEPDPDIEQLENLLSNYRYQAKPLDARFEQALTTHRSFFWVKYAAAAAIIVMAIAGAWLLRSSHLPDDKWLSVARVPDWFPAPGDGIVDELPPDIPPVKPPTVAPSTGNAGVVPTRPKRRAPQPARDEVQPAPPSTAAPTASELAVASPISNPFVDAEVARHIERAQVLLRSFRNTEGDAEFDLNYERQSSRRLLAQNVLLRRNAEAKGNLPIQGLLNSLEPFLIDIANLPDAPPRDEVAVIKARMEKKEIITALQVYSAPTLSRAF